ncbi:MAG TPA: polymer-forming cytoskeletal protein, partial [Nannocystaceae bacterium]|nr:polymer-forming cytoskeletal protein [Nannocystaceae bacterium]
MSQRQGAPKLGESVATVIGPDIQVIGRVEGAEDLRVQGYVEGTITLTESLIIEGGGVVVADVRARDVIIAGILVGDVAASGRVVLQAGARVVGNLQAPGVSVAAGAAVRGQVSMGEVADEGGLEGSAGGRASFGRWRGGGGTSTG